MTIPLTPASRKSDFVAAAIPLTRRFIVATWEGEPVRRRVFREVEAESHEDAVAAVVGIRAPADGRVVYEVWPETDPASILKITLEPRRSRHTFPA
jgi:hypothetical protein